MRVLAGLLLGVVLLASCGNEARGRLETAHELAFQGQNEAALDEVDLVLRALGHATDDDSRRVRVEALALGARLTHLFLGRPRDALAYYRALVQDSPSSEPAFEAREQMARIHGKELRDQAGAIAQHQAIVAGFPGRPGVDRHQYEVARGYQQLGDYEQVRTEARLLAERWPGSEYLDDVRFLVASGLHAEGRLEEAIATFEAIWTTWPASPLAPRARVEAGNCLNETGREAEALGLYVSALGEHPEPKVVQLKIERLRARMAARRAARLNQPPEH